MGLPLRKQVRRTLEAICPNLVLACRAHKHLIADKTSYLHQTGWLRSLHEDRPTSSDGTPRPWMNYPIIHFLSDRLSKDLIMFEFGSGFSTLFYADRVSQITSVEYDTVWFELVKAQAPANAHIVYVAKDSDGLYCRAIEQGDGPFDVVVVDGWDRGNCIKHAMPLLTPRGVILLDDSSRPDYEPGINYALSQGFRRLDFEGLKPAGTRIDRTTLLYRDGNCLRI